MNIIIKDSKTDKEFMIKGHRLDYEIFQRSKGKLVDGELRGKGDWVTCRYYPSTLQSAVYICIQWLLANPDDEEEVVVEAANARSKLNSIIRERTKQIITEIVKEGADG